MRKFLLALILALIVLTSAQLWFTRNKTDQKIQVEDSMAQSEAKLGGDFILTDQDGKKVSATDFRGKIMLVFFGFTRCPDVCPVTVAALSKTMELLGDNADKVVPVFISVDPDNDKPEVLKAYLEPFDKRMVGLTGSKQQIKQIADEYKVYYAKSMVDHDENEDKDAEKPSGKEAAKAGDDDYTIDHSAFIYMMGKDGKYMHMFPYNAPATDMARFIGRGLD